VAKGLGISAAEVIRCLYRAPSVLVEKADKEIAIRLEKLLTGIGYKVTLAPCSEPQPEPTQLYELAVYLNDASRFAEAAKKLSSFLGMPEDEDSKVLLTPPGTALGGVSLATIDAFKHHMNQSVEVSTCQQGKGLFHIFLGETPILVRNRLLLDLKNAGVDLIGQTGLLATDVAHDVVAPLWQRHKSNTALRIVNQHFLRYDLMLCPQKSGMSVEFSQLQRQCLLTHTDIPEDMLDEVMSAAPIAIIESVAHESMLDLMNTFNDHNIPVRADLITFQHLQLHIHSSPNIKELNKLLESFNVSPCHGTLPQITKEAFPEIQARVLQHALGNQGNHVELHLL
jgi:hypothetical protein